MSIKYIKHEKEVFSYLGRQLPAKGDSMLCMEDIERWKSFLFSETKTTDVLSEN